MGRKMEIGIPIFAPNATADQSTLKDFIFTVKRYRSEKTADEDGWRHVSVVLEPVNAEFAPIELRIEDEGSVTVVAELVEVIGSEPPV